MSRVLTVGIAVWSSATVTLPFHGLEAMLATASRSSTPTVLAVLLITATRVYEMTKNSFMSDISPTDVTRVTV